MIQRFSWKPALLRSAVTWEIDGTRLSGPDQSIDLADVTSAQLVDSYAKGFRAMRLDLFAGHDRRARLAQTNSASAPGDDPDFVAFWSCIESVAAELSKRDPALPVRVGETGKSAWIIFAIGVIAALGGIALFTASVSGLGGANGLGATLMPVLALVGFGLALSTSFIPWKKRPELPISALTGKAS